MNKIITDHLGQTYKNVAELCATYNLAVSTYYNRLSLGYSQKDALTKSIYNQSKYQCVDHLGNKYKTLTEMCKKYNILVPTFTARLELGWSLEDALTAPSKKDYCYQKKCVDHLGNEYKSINDMCKAYNVNYRTFKNRLHRHSLEQALTMEAPYIPIRGEREDHLGNKYKDLTTMCKAYNITVAAFRQRINVKKLSLEDALTMPVRQKKKKQDFYIDHLGNEYQTIDELGKKYNLSGPVIRSRLQMGWSLEKTLTTPLKKNLPTIGPDGIEYKTFSNLCRHFNVSYNCVKNRLKKGESLELAIRNTIEKQERKVEKIR